MLIIYVANQYNVIPLFNISFSYACNVIYLPSSMKQVLNVVLLSHFYFGVVYNDVPFLRILIIVKKYTQGRHRAYVRAGTQAQPCLPSRR